MATTLADIAKAAGVDRSTVCRVLAGQGRVSRETKQRIHDLARQMNYRPNRLARSLILGRSEFVGVVAAPSVVPMFHLLIDPIEHELSKRNLTMLFIRSANTEDGEQTTIDQLLNYQAAGLIAVRSASSPDTRAYHEYVESGGKLVIINKGIPGLDVPQVVVNDYLTSKIAVRHLIALGHTRIAHLKISSNTNPAQERDRGFRDAFAEAGLSFDESLIIPTDLSHEAGRDTTANLLTRPNRPTAILARHDAVALGAMEAVFAAGMSVPGDISIVGVGDVWNSSILRVPLTTVRYPLEEMSVTGTQLFFKLLDGEKVPPETIVRDGTLIIRESTAPPR